MHSQGFTIDTKKDTPDPHDMAGTRCVHIRTFLLSSVELEDCQIAHGPHSPTNIDQPASF